MASAQAIANAIVARIGQSKPPQWRVGLTHDPAARKQQWSNDGMDVKHWTMWTADTLADAQNVEAHFINKGMDGGTGGSLDSRKTAYVYIF